jgi:hypothetical protein
MWKPVSTVIRLSERLYQLAMVSGPARREAEIPGYEFCSMLRVMPFLVEYRNAVPTRSSLAVRRRGATNLQRDEVATIHQVPQFWASRKRRDE